MKHFIIDIFHRHPELPEVQGLKERCRRLIFLMHQSISSCFASIRCFTCPVVYFAVGGLNLTTNDVRRPVPQKDPDCTRMLLLWFYAGHGEGGAFGNRQISDR